LLARSRANLETHYFPTRRSSDLETMKFYEVGPNLNMTQHAITIRPICFSGKTFKKLPPDLQAAILKAGKEAGIYGRQIESSEDEIGEHTSELQSPDHLVCRLLLE